jgi:hypothetical protein
MQGNYEKKSNKAWLEVVRQDRACTSLVAGSGVGLALWPMRALPHGVVMVAWFSSFLLINRTSSF